MFYNLGSKKELVKRMQGKAFSKTHNLSAEMLLELSDAVITGIEGFSTMPNMLELASKSIKDGLDKRYGPSWHVVLGEGYAFDVSVQRGSYLVMYYNGTLGCMVFKT